MYTSGGEETARLIDHHLAHPEERSRIGELGRRIVKERYVYSRWARAVHTLYDRIVTDRLYAAVTSPKLPLGADGLDSAGCTVLEPPRISALMLLVQAFRARRKGVRSRSDDVVIVDGISKTHSRRRTFSAGNGREPACAGAR